MCADRASAIDALTRTAIPLPISPTQTSRHVIAACNQQQLSTHRQCSANLAAVIICCVHLQICVIRTLAFDENKAERAQRGLDLGALDAMSWPEYVWEYLHMHEDDLRNHRHALSELTAQS